MNVTPQSSTIKKESIFKRLAKGAQKVWGKRARTARDAIRAGYPKAGTNLRQGARLARQKAQGMLDFRASQRCLSAIQARAAA